MGTAGSSGETGYFDRSTVGPQEKTGIWSSYLPGGGRRFVSEQDHQQGANTYLPRAGPGGKAIGKAAREMAEKENNYGNNGGGGAAGGDSALYPRHWNATRVLVPNNFRASFGGGAGGSIPQDWDATHFVPPRRRGSKGRSNAFGTDKFNLGRAIAGGAVSCTALCSAEACCGEEEDEDYEFATGAAHSEANLLSTSTGAGSGGGLGTFERLGIPNPDAAPHQDWTKWAQRYA